MQRLHPLPDTDIAQEQEQDQDADGDIAFDGPYLIEELDDLYHVQQQHRQRATRMLLLMLLGGLLVLAAALDHWLYQSLVGQAPQLVAQWFAAVIGIGFVLFLIAVPVYAYAAWRASSIDVVSSWYLIQPDGSQEQVSRAEAAALRVGESRDAFADRDADAVPCPRCGGCHEH